MTTTIAPRKEECTNKATCLASVTWEIPELVEQYPAKWFHPNKKAVAKIATPSNASHAGAVKVSRWRAPGDLPKTVQTVPRVFAEAGFYVYQRPPPAEEDEETTNSIHWHLNFADPLLFGYGAGPLFAQDELLISEHPILASIGSAVDDNASHGLAGLRRLTVDPKLGPTPFLIQGAPRQCSIDTSNIYGDSFARASVGTVEKATTPLDPPMVSNIIAIAAPYPGYGIYSKTQIHQAFVSAYTGYRAMVIDSRGDEKDAVLHTGHWGCGAFGGNKGLMCAIQILAAGTAGVRRLHFWWGFTEMDNTAVEHGIEVANALNGRSLYEVFDLLADSEYDWGVASENHVPYQPPARSFLKQEEEAVPVAPVVAVAAAAIQVAGIDVVEC